MADRVSLRNNATLSGSIQFNDGLNCDAEAFAKYAAYVMQDDILFSYFTVTEALTFAARLKLSHMAEVDQNILVGEIINDLGLTLARDR